MTNQQELAGTFSDIQAILDNYLGEKQLLVRAIERAALDGEPSARIESAVARAFSRDQVRQFVAAIRLREEARKILADAGLGATAVSVRVTGIEPPREVRLALAADPEDSGAHEYEDLPARIREALRNFAVLEVIPRRHGDGEEVDDLLRDGEEVRLARQDPVPRTRPPRATGGLPVNVWCENPAHGAGLHPLTGTPLYGDGRTDPEACLYPHEPGPAGRTPVVGHPLTPHD
jgi:hypothetical protein